MKCLLINWEQFSLDAAYLILIIAIFMYQLELVSWLLVHHVPPVQHVLKHCSMHKTRNPKQSQLVAIWGTITGISINEPEKVFYMKCLFCGNSLA